MKAILMLVGASIGGLILWCSSPSGSQPITTESAQKMDPNSPKARDMALGASLKEQAIEDWHNGDLKLARAKLEQSLSLLSESAETPLLLARLCKQMSDSNASLGYYRKTFIHGPDIESTLDTDPMALQEYAEAAAPVSREESDLVYQKIASVGQDSIGGLYPALSGNLEFHALAHAKIALTEFMHDKFADAVTEMDKAASFAPKDPVIVYYRGYMNAQAGNKAQAKKYLLQAKQSKSALISQHAIDELDARSR